MKTRKLKATLTQKSIKDLQKELQKYEREIARKCKNFCNNLADRGISIARSNLGTNTKEDNVFASNIVFTKEFEETVYGCRCVMIMADANPVVRQWLAKDDKGNEITKTALVSPTLMVEFGSGWKADASQEHINAVNPSNAVGKGTFPSQNNMPFGNVNHAVNPNPKLGNKWAWKGLDGKWYTSSGRAPSEPMYKAYNTMLQEINRIAEESFK